MEEQNKKIMVYMGSYIKDRSEGKYNDHVTYDGDYNADYKSYMDLEKDCVCNIDTEKCSEFEEKNFIIKIQVKSYSFSSYLSNYTKLRNWYLKQLETHNEERVIIAFKMFIEERKANPKLSDSKIVEIINNRLKNHKEYIRGKY